MDEPKRSDGAIQGARAGEGGEALVGFRRGLYATMGRPPDALFELADTLVAGEGTGTPPRRT